MEQSNTQIIQELLLEFKIHRNAVMQMIGDLEDLKKNVDKLFPERLDARYSRFFEEKIKSATELFKTLLEMRKEIQKSLKEEIDLRRKIDIDDTEADIEKLIDIRGLAEKVQGFKDKRQKMREGTIEKAQRETDQIASEIVTVQESG
jgi:Skp family chaperone for outer membrane proteins